MNVRDNVREFLDRQASGIPHTIRDLARIPGVGRIMFSRDGGNARGVMAFRTHLAAEHVSARRPNVGYFERRHWHERPDGKWQRNRDLGSGLVTNLGVLAMANDFAWAAPSGAAINTLRLAKNHATGTGVTAAAATDIALQTVSTQGGQTPVAGTQVLVSAANLQKYQSVATMSYTGGEAVTEWGLFCSGTLSATTGTPFTATTATSATVTGTPYTASSSTVQGQQQNIVVAGTTTVWGLILSNTNAVLTIPAWYKTADGTAGATPGATEALTLRPVMWDHKVFSAINVVNGDSIQFTYTLTINSGG